ncbi:MAG: efflux RND transporter permease subunit [Gammaproteobacteria bacterium]
MRISELSIRRPVLAVVISLMLVIIGLISMQRLAVREYPDVDRPVVSITTQYSGASAPVIETKVTQVIEDAVAGVEGILKIDSDSEDERSQVRIEFDIARDMEAAANDVRDRIARVASALPEEADPPQIVKADANADSIMSLGFNVASMSMLDVTDYADRNLIDRLSTVPGVAQVSINGGRRYAMRIWVDRDALAARQLAVSDIESALRRENVELPAGRLESDTREFSLRTLVGLTTEDEFRRLVIVRGDKGHLVRLGEVAQVQLAAETDRTVSRFNGKAGILLSVVGQSKGNTLEIARGVREEIERLRPSLPPGATLYVSSDTGLSIEASLHEVVVAIVFALISVLAVIYAFLGSLRTTLIPAVTIPVSIIAAFSVMYALGYSINVLTLLGIVLAIGLVVDDAIVVLENVHKRAEAGEPPMVAAIRGSNEIGFAVIATTAVLVAVFIPISFLPGDLGRLFREFGLTLAAAVLFSALVALTLTPMLASKLPAMGSQHSRIASAVERFFQRVARVYDRSLRYLIARPWVVVGALVVLIGAGAWTFHTVPAEFVPMNDADRVFVTLEGPEGATFEYMDGQARLLEQMISKEMAANDDIIRYMMRVPNNFTGATSFGDVNTARAYAVLKDWHDRTRQSTEISRALARAARKLPGVRVTTGQATGLRRGSGQPLQAVIAGPDYETLGQWQAKLMQLARQNPGLENLNFSYKERKPQMLVAIDRDRAAELGVSLQTVGSTLQTVLGSRVVTRFIERGREYNVMLQARDDARRTVADLTNITVRSDRTGQLVPLANVVNLEEKSGAIRLSRFNRLRAVKITADLAADYPMGDAVKWFQDTVARELPPGATLMWDGDSAEFTRTSGQLYFTLFMALAIVYLVLAAQFESFIHPAIIMVTVPLALLGAVFGLKLYGLSVNIFSQIAVILLIGIAAKNGVLIVEFANQLRDRGVQFVEAIVQAAVARLRPVLMTSLCAAFGALPFLFASGAGAEQRRPIGVVVFCGTMVSVALTLFAVPAVYSIFARRTKSLTHVSKLADRLLETHPARSGEG